ncbi:MAG: hypothetical protein L0Z62_32600 [Gemmataceae bacterium]|nr:hypothetical protein [Gemmataceae bacterium]
MPPLVCPRCKSTNPDSASFCYFDGEALRGAQTGASGQLPHEFVFPSGRRCRTWDELASGCQEEWTTARDLLRRGFFQQFFTSCNRHDLAKTAAESMRQPDPNVGLTNLLACLPVARAQGPRLDLSPRRLHLTDLGAGETRFLEVTVKNQGQGALHGTLTVTDGGEWLRLGGGGGSCELNTAREQKVALQLDTRGLAAAQSYGAKLTIVTNGGAAEVPVRIDLTAHPFPRAPFQGARTQRELAEKMRTRPKEAVPLLENGEVARWFAANGWTYPVRGAPARGVAGVQQFFEALGLARPPALQLGQTEFAFSCPSLDPLRSQVLLFTASKKWVYANVESDAPWLRVLTPQVAGPQQATVGFEIDPSQLPRGPGAEGALRLSANGGQNLVVRVRAQAPRPPRPRAAGGLFRAVLTGAAVCLLLRLLLAPVADGYARQAATTAAASRVAARAASVVLAAEGAELLKGVAAKAKELDLPADGVLASYAGWLELPWPGILLDTDPALVDGAVLDKSLLVVIEAHPVARQQDRTREFRDSFASDFVRLVTLWTWWVGALAGAVILCRRGGGILNLPWGLAAGSVAGVAGAATLACLLLAGDLVPHAIWSALGLGGGAGMLVVWIVLAALCWTLLGAALGALLGITGALGRAVLAPVQAILAGLLRLFGLRGAAGYFAPA